MLLAPGTRLGPYEIIALLGAGGMGEVYRTRDTRLDRTVALKTLPAGLAATPEARERFRREARVVSALNHPHICVLHDIGCQDGIDYLVMEYLDGDCLQRRLVAGPLPIQECLTYAVQIASALDDAHGAGVVHRDLKPANVMLTGAGAKLLDFGLAIMSQTAPADERCVSAPTVTQSLTAEGTLVGTLQYMAPEQLEGKKADVRTDIFAFGVLLYEMLTGRRAFTGSSPASVMAAILTSEPESVNIAQPLSPPALDHLLTRCLEKDPARRWQCGRDLLWQLEWIKEEGGRTSEFVPQHATARHRGRTWLGS